MFNLKSLICDKSFNEMYKHKFYHHNKMNYLFKKNLFFLFIVSYWENFKHCQMIWALVLIISHNLSAGLYYVQQLQRSHSDQFSTLALDHDLR